MKKYFLFVALIFAIGLQSGAQDSSKLTYPLVISFESHCCGVPSDSVIRKFIAAYKKQQKIKTISAVRIGPMGREGEYYLAFRLTEIRKKKQKDFITKISQLKPLATDRGSFSFNEQMEIDASTLSQRTKEKTVVF